mgnify:CR=1 FL=1
MREHVKVYTGTSILVNRLAYLLDEQKIPSIIKNHSESGRLAGFGTTGDSVELHIFDSDIKVAERVFKGFEKEI